MQHVLFISDLHLCESHPAISTAFIHFLQHGNRDFLIGTQFLAATDVTLLDDPALITIFGERVLLSHGDALCTDDVAYQAFRQEVRNPNWQSTFLSQPIATRLQTVEAIRAQSEQAKTTKSMMIMDVNQVAVENLLRAFDYPPLFIHGHTHRPQQHLHSINNHTIKRVVLGDWYEQGSCLKLQADLSLFNTPILL